jgi:hypothetical protein
MGSYIPLESEKYYESIVSKIEKSKKNKNNKNGLTYYFLQVTLNCNY